MSKLIFWEFFQWKSDSDSSQVQENKKNDKWVQIVRQKRN